MSDFQQVKKRGQNPQPTVKYAEQHKTLLEMGFDGASITKALESSKGNLEAATAVLLDRIENHTSSTTPQEDNAGFIEKTDTSKSSRQSAPKTESSNNHSNNKSSASANNNNNNGKASSANKTETLQELHQRMMSTYKVNKCREGANHDKRVCMFWHSLSDRRRNPFEFTYSCFDCPTMARTGECKDGDNCQHSHTMLEKMFHPELYKISMCQRTTRGEGCDRGVLCAFAHNDTELRVISPTAVPKVPPPVDWQPTKPIPNSVRLTTILERVAQLIKEAGPEGAGGTEIARKYSERFHESLELEDEQKEKYKFRDLVSTHPNITIVTNRGGPLRYWYDESRTANDTENGTGAVTKAEEQPTSFSAITAGKTAASVVAAASSSSSSTSLATVRERLVQVIRSAGSDGLLGSELPRRYQELYHEKLLEVTDESGNKLKLKELLNGVSGVAVKLFKLQPKYVYDGPADAASPAPVVSAPAAAPAPAPQPAPKPAPTAASIVASSVPPAPAPVNPGPAAPAPAPRPAPTANVITGKSYSSVAATLKAALAAPPAETKKQAKESSSHSQKISQHEESSPVVVDEGAPSAEDPIFTQDNQLSDLDTTGTSAAPVSASNNTTAFTSSEPVTFQSAFGYGSNNAGLIGHSSHEDLIRKNPEPLMGAPGLTKIHSSDNGPSSISSLIAASSDDRQGQSQIATLQQTINKLQADLHSLNQDYESQTLQLKNVMQRLTEAEKNSAPDEHVKQQLKTKTEELAQKTRDVNKSEDELRKLREERKGDLNQFFINLSQIEDAISAMKCKEENYSDKVRPEDVQELLQFRKALRTFLATLKGQLKTKFDQLTSTQATTNALTMDANIAMTAPLTGIPQAPRYVPNPANGIYEPSYYAPVGPRTDAFAAGGYYGQPVDTGLCALPGCRNQGHYTCAGCQKVSYCGAEHQRLHWAQHSLSCHPHP